MFKCEGTNEMIGPGERCHQLITEVRPVKYIYSNRFMYQEFNGHEPIKIQNVCQAFFDKHCDDEPKVVGKLKVIEVNVPEKVHRETFIKESQRVKNKKKKKEKKKSDRPRYEDDYNEDY